MGVLEYHSQTPELMVNVSALEHLAGNMKTFRVCCLHVQRLQQR